MVDFEREEHKRSLREILGLPKGRAIKDDRQEKIDKLLTDGPEMRETGKHKKTRGRHRREKNV